MSGIRIQCETCNQLINATYIKSHSKVCGIELTCRVCGKSYCNPQYLKQHELSHNKSYVQECLSCSHCKAKFCAVSSLNKHKKTCPVLLGKTKIKPPPKLIYGKVARVYLPKRNDFIIKKVVDNVIHLSEEDVAAVEEISHSDDHMVSNKKAKTKPGEEISFITQNQCETSRNNSCEQQSFRCSDCNLNFNTFATFEKHKEICDAAVIHHPKMNDREIKNESDSVIHFSDEDVAAVEEIQLQDSQLDEDNSNYKKVKIEHVQQFTNFNQKRY